MGDLDLEETALERALSGTRRILTSAAFNLGVGGAVVITGAAAGLETYGDDPVPIALTAVGIGLAVYLISSLTVFIFQLGLAPVRQRNDLRRAMRSVNRISSEEVVGRVCDFARKGDDLLQQLKAAGGYTPEQGDEVERWTDEVASFLPLYCGGKSATEFSGASRGASRLVAKLEARIAVLDALTDSLTT